MRHPHEAFELVDAYAWDGAARQPLRPSNDAHSGDVSDRVVRLLASAVEEGSGRAQL
jgi:hypothetical protein